MDPQQSQIGGIETSFFLAYWHFQWCVYQTAIQIKDDAGIPNGTITREWIDSTSNETSRLGRHGPGKIDFPTNIDDKTKALLLATAMLVVSILVAGYKSSSLVGSYT